MQVGLKSFVISIDYRDYMGSSLETWLLVNRFYTWTLIIWSVLWQAGSRMLVWRKPLSFRLLNLISSSGVNMSSFFRLHCSWRRFVEHHLMVTLPFLHPLMASLIRVMRALRTTLTPFGLLESGEEWFLHSTNNQTVSYFYCYARLNIFFGFFKEKYSNLEK